MFRNAAIMRKLPVVCLTSNTLYMRPLQAPGGSGSVSVIMAQQAVEVAAHLAVRVPSAYKRRLTGLPIKKYIHLFKLLFIITDNGGIMMSLGIMLVSGHTRTHTHTYTYSAHTRTHTQALVTICSTRCVERTNLLKIFFCCTQ